MIYIIASNSYHIIDEEIDKIFPELENVEIYDFAKTNLTELVENVNYTSLFNDEKKVIVKNCDFLGSKTNINTDTLEKYLDNPNPLVSIIFTYNDKVDERKKIIKIIKEKYQLIYIKPLTYKDIISRIIEICKKNKFKISYENASFISNRCLNNYDIVAMELEKVFIFYNKPTEILREDLENIISKTMDDNNFKFVDAVIQKQLTLSLDILNDLKTQGIEPLTLISLLAREYRNMMISKSLLKSGKDSLFIAKTLKLQDWQVDKAIKNAYIYNIHDLENILLELTNLDYLMKTNMKDKFAWLEMFIIKEQ